MWRSFAGAFLLVTCLSCSSDRQIATAVLEPVAVDVAFETGEPNIITVSPAELRMRWTETARLVAVVTNKHGIVQPDRPISFSSNDPSVLSVSETGLLTPRDGGVVQITASTAGAMPLQAVANVTVIIGPPVALDLSPLFQGLTTSHGQVSFSAVGENQNVSYDCRINGVAIPGCASPLSLSGRGLAHGDEVLIEITGFDLRESPPLPGRKSTLRATVDDLAPAITDVSPSGLTGPSVIASFSTGANEEAGVFSCALDGQQYTPCQPGTPVVFTSLFNGPHVLHVSAVDAVGNRNEFTSPFEVDAAGPVFDPERTMAPVQPVGPSSTPETAIRFFAEDERGSDPVTYQCSLDDGPLVQCSADAEAGVFTWSGLSAGEHRVEIIAFDRFQNPGDPLTIAFVVGS